MRKLLFSTCQTKTRRQCSIIQNALFFNAASDSEIDQTEKVFEFQHRYHIVTRRQLYWQANAASILKLISQGFRVYYLITLDFFLSVEEYISLELRVQRSLIFKLATSTYCHYRTYKLTFFFFFACERRKSPEDATVNNRAALRMSTFFFVQRNFITYFREHLHSVEFNLESDSALSSCTK